MIVWFRRFVNFNEDTFLTTAMEHNLQAFPLTRKDMNHIFTGGVNLELISKEMLLTNKLLKREDASKFFLIVRNREAKNHPWAYRELNCPGTNSVVQVAADAVSLWVLLLQNGEAEVRIKWKGFLGHLMVLFLSISPLFFLIFGLLGVTKFGLGKFIWFFAVQCIFLLPLLFLSVPWYRRCREEVRFLKQFCLLVFGSSRTQNNGMMEQNQNSNRC